MLPWLIDDVEEIDAVFGGDALPYGIEANRRPCRRWSATWSSSTSSPKPIPIEDLFVPLAGAIGT